MDQSQLLARLPEGSTCTTRQFDGWVQVAVRVPREPQGAYFYRVSRENDSVETAHDAVAVMAARDGLLAPEPFPGIRAGILAVYPDAVITADQFDCGQFWTIRVPGRRSVFPVRVSVECGSEVEGLAAILARLA